MQPRGAGKLGRPRKFLYRNPVQIKAALQQLEAEHGKSLADKRETVLRHTPAGANCLPAARRAEILKFLRRYVCRHSGLGDHELVVACAAGTLIDRSSGQVALEAALKEAVPADKVAEFEHFYATLPPWVVVWAVIAVRLAIKAAMSDDSAFDAMYPMLVSCPRYPIIGDGAVLACESAMHVALGGYMGVTVYDLATMVLNAAKDAVADNKGGPGTPLADALAKLVADHSGDGAPSAPKDLDATKLAARVQAMAMEAHEAEAGSLHTPFASALLAVISEFGME